MGAFDAGITPPITNGAEPQLPFVGKRKKPKAWERLRQRGVVGIDGSGAGLTSVPLSSTGMKVDRAVARCTRVRLNAPEEKGLTPHWGWKKKPKIVPFKPNAIDGNNDGTVQDGTVHERPAGPKKPKIPWSHHGDKGPKPPKDQKPPKPPKPPKPWPPTDREKKKIKWKPPLLGDLLMERPGTTAYKLKKSDGRYVRPRRQLHKAIVEHFIGKAGKPKPEGERTVYFMGGGPSSLKSTTLKSGMTNIPEDALKIDTDEIKEFLPEYREWVEWGVGDAANLTQDESKHITQLVSRELIDGGYDFVYDTTGDGNYKGFKERLEAMRENGHRVVAHYMTNDVKTALALNQKRFEETGRKVPESNLTYIHGQVSRNVPQALRDGLFDELYLYDTDDLDGGPKLILSSKNGKTKIFDPVAYKKFLDKGKLADPPPQPKPGNAVTKPGGVWQPQLGFSDGKPKAPKGSSSADVAGPFDDPPVKKPNPNLPSPYGNPNKNKPVAPPPPPPPPKPKPKPMGPTDSSGKPIPPPPGYKPKDKP
jgi:predicted ABC-type ATPase